MHRRLSHRRLPLTSRRRFLQASAALAGTAPLWGGRARAQGGQVNVYNWDTYIGENTLAQFTEATGIEVRYDLYASNDELFGKLREGNPGYDVIFPSSNYVERMVAAEMLVPLDHAKIPNIANLDPHFTDPGFDRGRKFSLPYFWGTMGIGYRISAAEDQPPKGWADMLGSDRFAGRMSFLNDSDTIRIAMKYLGYSLNDKDPKHIEEAAQALIKAKPGIKAFTPDTGQDLLISGEIDICMEWNGDILQVMQEDDDLNYIVPDEGSLLWEDTMAIPKDGPNPDNALVFINYILDAKVHGEIASEVKFPLPNKAALEFIPAEDRDNPAMYPPAEVLARCEPNLYGAEKDALMEKALTQVLAA
jgi:spermidine/putrescine transport system substrate-binding protein